MVGKILVTGASGYLGGRLCQALLREGYDVRAFVRRTSDLSSLQPNSSTSPPSGSEQEPGGGGILELTYGDVTDLASVREAVSGCEVVFHSAALVEPWIPDPSRFITVNVGGLRNVLQACKETKTVQRIVYTSSFFALGPTDGSIADENQVHEGKFFCTEYEKSKAIADKIALESVSDGLPLVLLYPGVIYGCGKITGGNAIARMMIERFNWRLPGYIGNGKEIVSFCHVDDVANGHISAMKNGRIGERYLLTGDNVSMKFLFDLAADLTQTGKSWFYVPLWALDIYGWLSVFVARITGKIPFFSYPTVNVLRHQWAYSCDKAKRELSYSPRSLSEGLAEMLIWLKDLKLISY